MPAFRSMTSSRSADVVVVGGGTVGAWTAVLLAESGVKRVVLLEAATLGDGASSRAAGMVRAQGGTETAIRLGLATQQFYAASGDRFPLDCGFKAQGYLMPCFTDAEVQQAHDRIALQRQLGPRRRVALRCGHRRAAYRPRAGAPSAPPTRPATATSTRPATCWPTPRRSPRIGVDVRERCAFTGLRTAGGRVVGVDTPTGPIDTERVVLTGGPQLAEVGTAGGREFRPAVPATRWWSPRHCRGLDVNELPMVFDITSGIYWRPGESGGLLWGMSNPDEAPGWPPTSTGRTTRRRATASRTALPRVAGLGLQRAWAATIDYTPDHLPILGPLLTDDGPVAGTVVPAPPGTA